MQKSNYSREEKIEFVRRVKALRLEKGVSVGEACQEVGITAPSYNYWSHQEKNGWEAKKQPKATPALVSVRLSPKSDKDAILDLLSAQFQAVEKTLALLRGE